VDSGKRFGSSKQVKGDLDLKKKTWKSSMLKNLEEEGKEQAEQDELDDQDDQADEESALDLDAMNEKKSNHCKPNPPNPTKAENTLKSGLEGHLRAGRSANKKSI